MCYDPIEGDDKNSSDSKDDDRNEGDVCKGIYSARSALFGHVYTGAIWPVYFYPLSLAI